MHHLLARVLQMLPPNSIPPTDTCSPWEQRDRTREWQSVFILVVFFEGEKKEKKESSLQPWATITTTITAGEIIIQNYDSLISHLLRSNFGDYIVRLCRSPMLQMLISHCLVMECGPHNVTKPTGVHHRLLCANCTASLSSILFMGPKEQFAHKIGHLTLRCNDGT